MKKYLLACISIVCLSVQGFSQFGNLDTIRFDKPTQYIKLDTAKTNIWQIGGPQKAYFDSAYSKPNAIVTDTVGYYPKNNVSTFYLVMPAAPFFLNKQWDECTVPSFTFLHKYDMDTLQDSGTITVSADMGKTWQPLNYYQYYNMYTPVTGHSASWEYFIVQIQPAMGCDSPCHHFPTCDTALFRFTFYSDSINTNKEGWMIDDIITGWDVCEGINEYNNFDYSMSAYPNPASQTTTISFNAPLKADAVLNLYNPLGQLVRNADVRKGQSNTEKDVSGLSNGIYYYTLSVNGVVQATSKLVVIH